MPILSKTSYLIFIVSNFLGTVQDAKIGFIYSLRHRSHERCFFVRLGRGPVHDKRMTVWYNGINIYCRTIQKGESS